MDGAGDGRRARPGWLLFLAALLSGCLLSMAAASSAMALPEKFFGTTGQPAFGEPDWQAMQNAGVTRFHMEIEWKLVDEAGGFGSAKAWEETYDKFFERAAKHNIAVLPYLYTQKDGSQGYYLTRETAAMSEWLQFVRKAVSRYGPAGEFWVAHEKTLPQFPVSVWEVWNEPNLSANSPKEAVSGSAYGQFFKATAGAIHEARSSALAVVGGIYEDGSVPAGFIEAMLGVKELGLDGVALHPYALNQTCEAKTNPEICRGEIEANRLSAFESEIKKTDALVSAEQLWITEFGWPLVGTGATYPPALAPANLAYFETERRELEQAELLRKSYTWLKANWSTYKIQLASWYWYRDADPNPLTTWVQHAGLRDVDGTYRPSWYAYQEEAGATSGPNPEWHSEGVAGSLSSAPALAAVGPEHHLDMVARGSDKNIYFKSWLPASGWSEWLTMGGSTGEVASGPSAASWGQNRLDVAALDPNHSVDHWWFDGSWHSENIAGNMTSAPAIAAVETGHLDLVARGTDNQLYYRSWTAAGGSWSEWAPIASGTGEVSSGPGVASWGAGRLDVVALSPTKSVYHWWWDGSSWHWENIPGEMTSDPSIAAVGPGHLDLVARGTDEHLYYRSWTSVGGWTEWAPVAGGTGKVGSGAGVASWGNGRLDVTALSPEASVEHWYWGVPY